MNASFGIGLENLATAVMLVDRDLAICYANPAAENLFKFSLKTAFGHPLSHILVEPGDLTRAMLRAIESKASFTEHELAISTLDQQHYQVTCIVTPQDVEPNHLVLEFHQIDQAMKIAREERMLLQSQINRELLRNLAHEIKNPLGGIRGSAQLLEGELPKTSLKEYTQVIIKEADRLQSLMDRLLTPHRLPKFAVTNIHEVLERVRSLLLAENPKGITIRRDYDTSLPEFIADKEQLIQAVLNIARNAVQAMHGEGNIRLATRIARHVTLAKRHHRLAISLKICDTGPGIPPEIRVRITESSIR